jgi:xanthine dehydrogenase accessory factor
VARQLVLIKGAGDLASGVAFRLHRAGFSVVMTELPQPLVVRRTVAFAEAVYTGTAEVEGIRARRVERLDEVPALLGEAQDQPSVIPVLVDPEAQCLPELQPAVLVDGVMAKRNTGTHIGDAPLVIALGPGFTAGVNCHAVIETNRGHWLGRVYWNGSAQPDTKRPAERGGQSADRVLRAPCDGVVHAHHEIGDWLEPGDLVAEVDGQPVRAKFAGFLRGLIHPGVRVPTGLKIGDVDATVTREQCFTVSDKSLAVGGGVLEAILTQNVKRGA